MPRRGHRYLPSLSRLREQRRWSQAHLAGEADLQPGTISRLESGYSATFQTVHKLAAALGVPTQALHGR